MDWRWIGLPASLIQRSIRLCSKSVILNCAGTTLPQGKDTFIPVVPATTMGYSLYSGCRSEHTMQPELGATEPGNWMWPNGFYNTVVTLVISMRQHILTPQTQVSWEVMLTPKAIDADSPHFLLMYNHVRIAPSLFATEGWLLQFYQATFCSHFGVEL